MSSQNLQSVIRYHIAAFEAMGGSPEDILYDRMKTVVIGEDESGGLTPRIEKLRPFNGKIQKKRLASRADPWSFTALWGNASQHRGLTYEGSSPRRDGGPEDAPRARST